MKLTELKFGILECLALTIVTQPGTRKEWVSSGWHLHVGNVFFHHVCVRHYWVLTQGDRHGSWPPGIVKR